MLGDLDELHGLAVSRAENWTGLAAGQLLHEVWGPGSGQESHYLRVYMNQLRQKIEPDPARPRFLLTETSVGYRFRLTS